MLSRFMNSIFPPATPRSHEPGEPIKKLADEMESEGAYYFMLSQFLEIDIPKKQDTAISLHENINQLHKAVIAGDLDTVKDLVEHQKVPVDAAILDGNYRPQRAETALLSAVMHRKWEIALYLLDQGADVNFRQSGKHHADDGMSPLLWLSSMALKKPDAEEYDRDKTVERIQERENAKILFKHAMDKGGDLNLCDHSGRTVLHNAIRAGDREMFDYCLNKGMDPNIKLKCENGTQQTPLREAALYDRVEMAEELLKRGADVEGRSEVYECTPLATAAYNKNRGEMLKLLIKYGADPKRHGRNGLTALHNAMTCGDAGNARILIENGASLYAQDVFGNSVLDDFYKGLEGNEKQSNSGYVRENFDGTVFPSEEMKKLVEEHKWIRIPIVWTAEKMDFSDSEELEASSDEEVTFSDEVSEDRPRIGM